MMVDNGEAYVTRTSVAGALDTHVERKKRCQRKIHCITKILTSNSCMNYSWGVITKHTFNNNETCTSFTNFVPQMSFAPH